METSITSIKLTAEMIKLIEDGLAPHSLLGLKNISDLNDKLKIKVKELMKENKGRAINEI